MKLPINYKHFARTVNKMDTSCDYQWRSRWNQRWRWRQEWWWTWTS